MARPTEDEAQLISRLRQNVEDILEHDYQKDDMFLIRWIRAKQNDLEKAEEMLRNSLQWRKEYKVDEILDLKLKVDYSDKFPWKLQGHSKEGHPVITIPLGEWDIEFSGSDISESQLEDFGLSTLKHSEEMMQCVRLANESRPEGHPPITQFVIIVDMTGFVYSTLFNHKIVQRGLKLVEYFEANYPQLLHACFIINAGSMVSLLMAIVKPALDPMTFERIKPYGPEAEEWREAILEIVDEDILPQRFGGTKEEVDSLIDSDEFSTTEDEDDDD